MENARRNAKIEMEALGVCLADPDSLIHNFDLRLASKLSESLEAPPPTDEDVLEFDECEEVVYEGENTLHTIDS